MSTLKSSLKRGGQMALTLSLILAGSFAYSEQVRGRVIDLGDEKMRVVFAAVPTEDGNQHAGPAPKIAEKEFLKFAEIMRAIGEFTGPLDMPEEVLLRVAPVSFNPSAEPLSDALNMGIRFAQKSGDGRVFMQNPSEMIPVMAHEFGHLVFNQNILARFSFFERSRELWTKFEKLLDRQEEILDRAEEIEAIARKGGGTPALKAEYEALEKEMKELAVENEKITVEFQKYQPAFETTSPYNEFFADVIAVLYTEDPDSVADSIHMVMPNEGKRSHRDMSRSEIENRAFKKRGTGTVYHLSPHAVFAETRRMMWDEYLKRPTLLKKHKTEISVGVARAVLAEIKWLVEGQKELKNAGDDVIALLNKRLSTRIRTELKRLN